MYGIVFTGFAKDNPSTGRSTGGYRIATHVRKLGWDIEVIDYVSYWNLTNIKKLVSNRNKKHAIKWIGISITWNLYEPIVKNIIDYFKKHHPEVIVIVGGNQNFNLDLNADYYVYGFGERAVEAILKYEFSNGQKPSGVPCYKGWAINALHFYPAWPMDNYSVEYEDRDFLAEDDVLTLELSRGCKFKCKFCEFPVLGVKEDTSVSEEIMYRDLKDVYDKWGIKNYIIADETINERDEKIIKLGNAVNRVGFEPNFTGFIRLDLFNANRHQIELLARARIWGHFYGVETLNHRAGKTIGKGLDPEKNKQLMLDTKNYMLSTLGYYRGTASFIAGLPYETKNDIENTHQWLRSNWQDQHWHFWPLLIPKTTNYRLSAFGEDFSKYGYRELTLDELNVYKKTHEDVYTGFLTKPQVLWKNDEGDFFEFSEMAERLDSINGEEPSKIGNFTVWALMSLGLSPEEAMSETSHYDHTKYKKIKNHKIFSYIEKKLSL